MSGFDPDDPGSNPGGRTIIYAQPSNFSGQETGILTPGAHVRIVAGLSFSLPSSNRLKTNGSQPLNADSSSAGSIFINAPLV